MPATDPTPTTAGTPAPQVPDTSATPAAPGAPDAPPGDALPAGPFVGRESFRQRVRQAIATAAAQHWREWTLCDPDFRDWPLGEAELIQHLQHWAQGSGQRLILLARSYDEVTRLHPRFAHWRRQWAHKIDARLCAANDAAALPALLHAPGWALLRPQPHPGYGHCGSDAHHLATTRENLDTWLSRARPGFPVTTLGL